MKMKKETQKKTLKITLVALFTALITVGAFIKIPIPYLPLSMQTFFTTLAGVVLGSTLGTVSVLAYIFMGLIGLPIFTQGGGFSYVLNPSFGYLLGFILGAFVSGKIVEKQKKLTFLNLFLASIFGAIAVYIIGIPYLVLISKFYLGNSLTAKTIFINYFLLTIPGDIIKCVLVALVAKRIIPIKKRLFFEEIVESKKEQEQK